ncbi:HGxxPAAW family protein [Antribacter gilvus]|uniref:HGxxPAAW family protein n=1 Tax=Antribacter gilvus TaxID=2304675 RepID=UPI000F76CB7B|nr:HGxxPAAW family protein [Antribacter gilvus]
MVDNTPQAAELAYLPPATPPTNHGHTVAAWVTMIGISLGVVISAVGVTLMVALWFWAGLVVVGAGLVAGLALRNMGLGQKKVDR